MYANWFSEGSQRWPRRETGAACRDESAKLPRHVRFFTRRSRSGLPAPAYAVTVERGIRIPMPDGTHQLADRYIPRPASHAPRCSSAPPMGAASPTTSCTVPCSPSRATTSCCRAPGERAGPAAPSSRSLAERPTPRSMVGCLRVQPWSAIRWPHRRELPRLHPMGAGQRPAAGAQGDGRPGQRGRLLRVPLPGRCLRDGSHPHRGGCDALPGQGVPHVHGRGPAAGAHLPESGADNTIRARVPSWRSGSGSATSRTGWLTRPFVDPYWAPRRANPDIKAAPPVHLLGGWYDVVIDQTLDSYRQLRQAGACGAAGHRALEPHVRVQQGHADRRRGGARVAAGAPRRDR